MFQPPRRKIDGRRQVQNVRIVRHLQPWKCLLRAQEGATGVDLLHQIITFHWRTGCAGEPDRAGVVHQDINAAEVLSRAMHGIHHSGFLTYVQYEGQGASTGLFHSLCGGVDSARKLRVATRSLRGNSHVGTISGGAQGDGFPDATAGTGDEKCLALERACYLGQHVQDYTVSMYDALVETETLAAHIGDPDWVVFDCRFSLTDTMAGVVRYAEGHIPGARYLNLDRDLSSPATPDTGRHPLPDPAAFADVLGRAGVDSNTQVVGYDDSSGTYAARLWWLARWLGHRKVAVLNGGWQQWLKEEREVTREVPVPVMKQFTFMQAEDHAWLSSGDVLEMVRGRKRGRLFDVRGPLRFRGEEEPIDPVAGHVPGAVNLPYTSNVAEDGRFKCPALLRQQLEQALDGVRPEHAVFMCGSGVTACQSLLAMEAAGLKGARLYAGSWSEWIRDPARPVATG